MPRDVRTGLGIAFGHCRIRLAAVRNNATTTQLVVSESGSRDAPAMVAYVHGEWLVGEAALTAKHATITVPDLLAILPREHESDAPPTPLPPAGDSSPELILGHVFATLKKNADALCGSAEDQWICAVLAVPNDVDSQGKACLRAAARRAKIDIMQMIDEHDAVLLAHDLDNIHQPPLRACVIDVGGSRSRCSLYQICDGVLLPLWTRTDHELSTLEMTRKLEDFAMHQLRQRQQLEIQGDKATQRLRAACARAAKILSQQAQADIEADALVDGIDVRIRVTRPRYDDMCSPLVSRLKQLVHMPPPPPPHDSVDILVLAGGGSKNDRIKREALHALGQPTLAASRSIECDEAAVFGAAKQVALLLFGLDPSTDAATILANKRRFESPRLKALNAMPPTMPCVATEVWYCALDQSAPLALTHIRDHLQAQSGGNTTLLVPKHMPLPFTSPRIALPDTAKLFVLGTHSATLLAACDLTGHQPPFAVVAHLDTHASVHLDFSASHESFALACPSAAAASSSPRGLVAARFLDD